MGLTFCKGIKMNLTIANDKFTARPMRVESFPWFKGELNSTKKEIHLENDLLGVIDISYDNELKCTFNSGVVINDLCKTFPHMINIEDVEKTILVGMASMFLRKVSYDKAKVLVNDVEDKEFIKLIDSALASNQVNKYNSASSLFIIEETQSNYSKLIYALETANVIDDPVTSLFEGIKGAFKFTTMSSLPHVLSDFYTFGFLFEMVEGIDMPEYKALYPKLYRSSFSPVFMFLMSHHKGLFNYFIGEIGSIKLWCGITSEEDAIEYFKRKEKNTNFETCLLMQYPHLISTDNSINAQIIWVVNNKPQDIKQAFEDGKISSETIDQVKKIDPKLLSGISIKKDDIDFILTYVKVNKALPNGYTKIDELPEEIQCAVCLFIGTKANSSYELIAKTASTYSSAEVISSWFASNFTNTISAKNPDPDIFKPEVIESITSRSYNLFCATEIISVLWRFMTLEQFNSFYERNLIKPKRIYNNNEFAHSDDYYPSIAMMIFAENEGELNHDYKNWKEKFARVSKDYTIILNRRTLKDVVLFAETMMSINGTLPLYRKNLLMESTQQNSKLENRYTEFIRAFEDRDKRLAPLK